jgi:preprotein translocase subunit SecB
MKKVKDSAFKLEQFVVRESHIVRNPSKQGDISVAMNPSGIVDPEAKLFHLYLDVELKDENDSLKINIAVLGIFKFRQNVKLETLENYFYVNAPAIMFPYVRSYISALTSLSGLNVINLPLLNMTSMGAELKANTKTIE